MRKIVLILVYLLAFAVVAYDLKYHPEPVTSETSPSGALCETDTECEALDGQEVEA